MRSKLKKLFSSEELLRGNFGIEREGLRVTPCGEIATTPHPTIFEPKIKHPYITTDFAESQIEFITPPMASVDEVHVALTQLYDILMDEIGDELLWPQSMPAAISAPDDIQPANYGSAAEEKKAKAYRQFLIKKYGVHRQLISGLHYNFSFTDDMLQRLYQDSTQELSYQAYKDQLYLKVVRNYIRYRWLLIYLLGSSPALHETYAHECLSKAQKIEKQTYSSLTHVSYRNSLCGYQNKEQVYVNYDSVSQYVRALNDEIQKGTITSAKEFYSPIRLKTKDQHDVLNALISEGIAYLEIRSLDLNPFEKTGISCEDLSFVHLFILYCLTKEESDDPFWQIEGDENAKMIACQGLDDALNLYKEGRPISKTKWAINLLDEMLDLNHELQLNQTEMLNTKRKMVKKEVPLIAEQLIEALKKTDYLTFHLNLAKTYKAKSQEHPYGLVGYEDLELSTQILIRESIKQGLNVQLLDRHENFIALSQGNHIEYIKQATKTSLDKYSTVLVMENKLVTKLLLSSHGIKVPKGDMYESITTAKSKVQSYVNKPIVIKPKSTNFGLGISIFKEGGTERDLNTAIDIAFSQDSTILIEEFIKGKEYRFLVIGDEVAGVLHRVPANVVGDSLSTIEQLVQVKNQSPLRGKGYNKPLEKIVIDQSANLFLKEQGYTKDSVIEAGKTVYLRENSNISTGGDSLDFTDQMPAIYKEIAIAASQAVGAFICGVDMMIEKLDDVNHNYAIIELNFNPAIHIHCFPYNGKQRNIARPIIKALGFTQ